MYERDVRVKGDNNQHTRSDNCTYKIFRWKKWSFFFHRDKDEKRHEKNEYENI